MTRPLLIVANWKMNNSIEDAMKFFAAIKADSLSLEGLEVVVCPPFTSLYSVGVVASDLNIKWGAQNCHFKDGGAFTGEVSAVFLKELDCTYVIVGHSERRKIFGETDEMVGKKIMQVFQQEMKPIFCVGETLEEREAEKTSEVIERQLHAGLKEVLRDDVLQGLVIAYEPVWAIGTGKTATPKQAQEVHAFIRGYLARHYGVPFAQNTKILYGGSVKPGNVKALMNEPDIDGGLVGGASVEATEFLAILKNCKNI